MYSFVSKVFPYASTAVLLFALLFLASVVFGWTGPTGSPPNNNVNAPVNVGTSAQVKNGALSVNSITVFGNTLLSGTGRYLNWGTTAGTTGYGIRDNAGTLEFKNNNGNWAALAGSGGVPWITSGNNIYNSNTANVGIGTTNPTYRLTVYGPATSGVDAIRGTAGISNSSTYGVMGIAGSYYGALARGDGYSFVGQGTLYNNGTVYGTSFLYLSDKRLKENIEKMKSGLSKILALSPVTFTWKKDMGVQAGKDDFGFIAQEVEAIVPEAVTVDTASGMKAVDYPKLVPILVKAMQEQQEEIDALKAEVAALKDGR